MECVSCQCGLTVVILLALVLLCRSNKYVKFYVNYVIYFGAAIVISLLCIPIFMLRPFNVKNGAFAAKFGALIPTLIGIKYELRNKEILAVERGAVIISNHQNSFDNLGMYKLWSTVGQILTVSKTFNFYLFPFGPAIWLAGAIFIDRTNPKKANQQLDAAAKTLKREKLKMWMFPEGTRNTSGTLLPFKKGAFRIAIQAQVPLIPVVFSPYTFIDTEKLHFGRGRMVVTTLPAIPTEGLTMGDLDDLIQTTRKAMQECYNSLAIEVTN